MRPIAGRLVPRRLHEALVLRASQRKDAELESVDDHAMRRSLVLLAALRSHDEPTSRNWREPRGERGNRIGHHAIIVQPPRTASVPVARSLRFYGHATKQQRFPLWRHGAATEP